MTHTSTGPRTEAGKAASAQNALRHGLSSSTLLIPGEDPEAYAALRNGFLTHYQPTDVIEALLVEDLARHHWLKDRAIRLQGEALAIAPPGEIPATFAVLLRYQTTNERAFHKALATLQALRKQELATEKKQQQFVSQQRRQEDDELNTAINAYIYGPMPTAPSPDQLASPAPQHAPDL